jgi:hypothetical protein
MVSTTRTSCGTVRTSQRWLRVRPGLLKGIEAGTGLGHAVGKGAYLTIGLGNLPLGQGIGSGLNAGIGGKRSCPDRALSRPLGGKLVVEERERAHGDRLAGHSVDIAKHRGAVVNHGNRTRNNVQVYHILCPCG